MSRQAVDEQAPAEPAPTSPRPWWRQPLTWIGFAISGLAIVTFITMFDMRRVGRMLLQVSFWHVAASAVVFGAAFMVRSFRWRLLLMPLARLPFGKVRDVLIIGYMANLLLPARMGEVARALALWRVTGTSRRSTLTTIGMARLFDGCLLLGLLVLLGLLFDLPVWARNLTFVFVFFMGGVLTVALWLAFHERSFFWLMERLLFFLPRRARQRVVSFFQRFAAGTHVLRSPALMAQVAVCTVLVWSLEYVVYLTMMRGFSIDLPAWSALLALVVTNIGIAAPSAPGYVGVFEAACSSAVIAVGLDPDQALSYAIGVHLMMYVFLVVVGQVMMYRLGLRMSDITGASKATDK